MSGGRYIKYKQGLVTLPETPKKKRKITALITYASLSIGLMRVFKMAGGRILLRAIISAPGAGAAKAARLARIVRSTTGGRQALKAALREVGLEPSGQLGIDLQRIEELLPRAEGFGEPQAGEVGEGFGDVVGENRETMVEWVATTDIVLRMRTCEVCEALDGEIMTMTRALELWPVHPNCRCSTINVN